MTGAADTPSSSCHALLRAALDAALPAERPTGPFALGGPAPVCPPAGLVELGLWLASLLESSLSGVLDLGLGKRITGDVRAFLARPRRLPPAELQALGRGQGPTSRAGRLCQRLLMDSKPAPSDPTPVAVLRLAAGTAVALARGTNLLTHLAPAVARVIGFLREAPPETGMSVRDFLRELDARLLRLECRAAIEVRLPAGTPVPEVAEVLWRCADGGRQARHFIARLGDGSLGLVTKLGRAWAWVRGGRDEVLASVPDAHFESAARAVMARIAADA